MRVLTMPDKWEYPWFAAWDLAFQCVTSRWSIPSLPRKIFWLLLFEQFQHPNGQIPAYEWEFSDLNPPVHAWAVWRVYQTEASAPARPTGFPGDVLPQAAHQFRLVGQQGGRQGNNVFEGGFLGLDNITVVDRSEKIPGRRRARSSPTRPAGWAFFCLYMMRIALELAKDNPPTKGWRPNSFSTSSTSARP